MNLLKSKLFDFIMGSDNKDKALKYNNLYGISWRQKTNQMVIYLGH